MHPRKVCLIEKLLFPPGQAYAKGCVPDDQLHVAQPHLAPGHQLNGSLLPERANLLQKSVVYVSQGAGHRARNGRGQALGQAVPLRWSRDHRPRLKEQC